jgi:alpha,alpha-trehalase
LGVDQPAVVLSPLAYKAAIFQLDEVIARTSRLDAVACKQSFDEYLRFKTERESTQFGTFDIERDYAEFIGGQSRSEGVRRFLASRGIGLRFGSASDAPGTETVCGLRNRLDERFLERLRIDGVDISEPAIATLRQMRQAGTRIGLTTSHRNGVAVLEAAGIQDLFDAVVDDTEAERLQLRGKPDPDTLQAAAKLLAVPPACTIVVQDSISGVRAGELGGFGCVIGVDRLSQPGELLANGADVVVKTLSEVRILPAETVVQRSTSALPSAFAHLRFMRRLAKRRRVAVFLDYDGTLTPIVRRPEDAVMSEETRRVVRALAQRFTVAVVSGRDLADVQSRVSIEGITYSGSHGFEIAIGDGRVLESEEVIRYLPALDAAERELMFVLAGIPGAQVERKRFSVAAHYRNVDDDRRSEVTQLVDQVLENHPDLRMTRGKMVFDLQPALEWDKGAAFLWIIRALGLDSCETLPIYVGDDITDEDAFREIQPRGIGVLVREGVRTTAAQYAVESTDEVRQFLEQLAD